MQSDSLGRQRNELLALILAVQLNVDEARPCNVRTQRLTAALSRPVELQMWLATTHGSAARSAMIRQSVTPIPKRGR